MHFGNIPAGVRTFLGHFIRQFMSQISSDSSKQGHTKRINPKVATESEFDHIFVFQCAYVSFRYSI